MRNFLFSRAPAALGALCALISSAAYANHGPGASGGGSATISGETLHQGRFELSLRQDYVQFEHFSQAAAAERAAESGDFDALNHAFLTTVDASYGITDDLQAGAALGFFYGRDFIGAASNGTDVDLGTANPSGLTDLSLSLKYRVLKGMPGNLSLIAGVILPTGRSDVTLSNGERISPTDQPGTGRYGMPLGVGYSRFLTSRITIDASALYTLRFQKDFFKVGDRFDLGVALAYRFTDSITTFPQYSAFLELNNVYLFRDYDHGSFDANSGSETLFLTPGFRIRFTPQAALTLSPSVPVYQHVNGDQGKVDFKFAAILALSF